MPAVDRGADVVASSPHSRRCEASTNSGGICKAWAKRDSEYCWLHSMSPAERLAAARRGGLTTAAKKRAAKAGNPRSGLQSHVRLEDVLSVCTSAMTATFAEQGLPTEPDWDARLLSLVVLLEIFPKQYRAKPEEAAALLLKVLPDQVRPTEDEDEMERQIIAGYKRGRDAWKAEQGRVAALRGLFLADEYPRDLVAPWEDRAALDKELAAYMRKLERRLEGAKVTAVYTPV